MAARRGRWMAVVLGSPWMAGSARTVLRPALSGPIDDEGIEADRLRIGDAEGEPREEPSFWIEPKPRVS